MTSHVKDAEEEDPVFVGLNEDFCAEAWEMILPAIAHGAHLGVLNKHAGCIVVLDPASDDFEVLFTKTINGEEADAKYVEIAHAKARVTHRTGLPSSLVQTQYPYLYQEGDTKWGGSTIDDGGLVVAFSGVQAVYDEMISEWMVAAIRALCRNDMVVDVMLSGESFLRR